MFLFDVPQTPGQVTVVTPAFYDYTMTTKKIKQKKSKVDNLLVGDDVDISDDAADPGYIPEEDLESLGINRRNYNFYKEDSLKDPFDIFN